MPVYTGSTMKTESWPVVSCHLDLFGDDRFLGTIRVAGRAAEKFKVLDLDQRWPVDELIGCLPARSDLSAHQIEYNDGYAENAELRGDSTRIYLSRVSFDQSRIAVHGVEDAMVVLWNDDFGISARFGKPKRRSIATRLAGFIVGLLSLLRRTAQPRRAGRPGDNGRP